MKKKNLQPLPQVPVKRTVAGTAKSQALAGGAIIPLEYDGDDDGDAIPFAGYNAQ